jgi:hypothetical protein
MPLYNRPEITTTYEDSYANYLFHSSGKPNAGVKVILYDVDKQYNAAHSVTDKYGKYEFKGISSGEYEVQIFGGGGRHQQDWFRLVIQEPGNNVQSDWDSSSGDNEILNKPTIPSGNQIIDWTASSAGSIHKTNLPAIALTSVQTAESEIAQLALTTEEGDAVVRTDEKKTYMRNSGVAGDMTDFTLLQTPTGAEPDVEETDWQYRTNGSVWYRYRDIFTIGLNGGTY